MAENSKKINSHDKGARGERELIFIFNKRFPNKKFFRTVRSGAFTGGANRINTIMLSESQKNTLTADLFCDDENFKFSIEHKAYQSASFWDLFNECSDMHSWMKQCQEDADFSNKQPMLIVKYNNHKRIAFLKINREGYVFEHNGWYCYNLEELLEKQPDDFFFGDNNDKRNFREN